MKKLTMIALSMIISSTGQCTDWYDYDNAEALFSASDNNQKTVQVTWQYANDVHKECNKERVKRGHEPLSNIQHGCSFHNDGVCLIITGRKTTMHTVGHEIRHCFAGSWHQ
jgi:hypothetical protein